MNTVRLFIVALLLSFASSVTAQSLWQGTIYGMSLEQVKTVVPRAAPPAKPNRLADGSEELLRLEDVELVNKKFAASFYFRTGKLSQVTLSLEKGHSFHEAMLVFDSLTEALRAKYGHEINRGTEKGVLNRANAEWLSGRTNINLIAISVGEGAAILNINYQIRVAREADKL